MQSTVVKETAQSSGAAQSDDPGVADGWYLVVGTPKNGFPCLAQRGSHAPRYLAGFKKALEAYMAAENAAIYSC